MNFISNPIVTYVALLLFVISSLFILYLKLQLKNTIEIYRKTLEDTNNHNVKSLDSLREIIGIHVKTIEDLQKSLSIEKDKVSLEKLFNKDVQSKNNVYLDKLNRILGLVVNNQSYERRLLSNNIKDDYNQEQLDKRRVAIKSLITRIKNLSSVNEYLSTNEMFFMKNLIVAIDKYEVNNVEDLSAQIQEIIELEELFLPQVSASEDDF